MIRDALNNEILTPRGLDYRRNTIGIGILLIILTNVPNTDWSNMNFLGIKIGGDSEDTKNLVLMFICATYTYHGLFFLYYALRDYRSWWSVAAEPSEPPIRAYFPEAKMFFGFPPKQEANKRQTSSGWNADVWKFSRNKRVCTWEPEPLKENSRSPDRYNLPAQDVARAREKLIWFYLIDLGVPIAIFLLVVATCLFGPVRMMNG